MHMDSLTRILDHWGTLYIKLNILKIFLYLYSINELFYAYWELLVFVSLTFFLLQIELNNPFPSPHMFNKKNLECPFELVCRCTWTH